MPLVRIDIKRNTDASYAKKLGKVIYDSMKAAINALTRITFRFWRSTTTSISFMTQRISG